MAKKKTKSKKKTSTKKATRDKKPKKSTKPKKSAKPKKGKKVKKKPKGLHHLKGMRKLDAKIVASIRKNYRKGDGLSITKIWDIVKKKGFKVTYASVRNVCIRFTWKHAD